MEPKRHLVYGAGNLLLSDEGFGVHLVRYLSQRYQFPEDVEVLDAGTLGIMVSHKLEEARHIHIVDVVATDGEPGTLLRFEKEDLLLGRAPVKLSPHQIGIQEVLTLAELRGRGPDRVTLYGVIPLSYDAGVDLSPPLRSQLPEVARMIVDRIRGDGVPVTLRPPPGISPLLSPLS
ncbi:MAG: HyaD/HybD family hydrogenase maturation endopeptidase [Desulfuromonadia bacterium]